MAPQRYLLVTDTPSIKSFVFGTDALAETRGASALLDRLNRTETEKELSDRLGSACKKVFANGGTGQFVITAEPAEIEAALQGLARRYREETGGDARIVWAFVPWPEGAEYEAAVREAHFQLRLKRETASDHYTTRLHPLFWECDSTSYLPARTEPYKWGNERKILSESSRCKYEASRVAHREGPWAGWMQHLAALHAQQRDIWDNPALRPRDAVALEEAREGRRARKGYVGLVYADGNAMGRLVQELDSPETCSTFSELVDGSVRDACHQALDEVCAREIASVRNGSAGPLPADILLLGGDDLLVLLPADLALDFALGVTDRFDRITREKINRLPQGDPARDFFRKRLSATLEQHGLTISCGVALAGAKHPFYLLLELAEDLLKNAKRGGSQDPVHTDYWAPSYIDFHLVTSSASADLEVVREEDYQTTTGHRRTLRPYSAERLAKLRSAARRLHEAKLPRSKLQDLFDAALEPRHALAELRAQELFGRLRQDRTHCERLALRLALQEIEPVTDYPWCEVDDPKTHRKILATALADLIEACDLFPVEEAS